MTDYCETPIEELIDEYSVLAKDPRSIAYIDVGEELRKRAQNDYSVIPEREFYKEACGYEYTIELPYDELIIGRERAWIRHHDYSFIYNEPDGTSWNTCLSLCGYSREDIVEMIEKRIRKAVQDEY